MPTKATLFLVTSASNHWKLYDTFRSSLDKAGFNKLAASSPSEGTVVKEVEVLQNAISTEIANERDVLVLAYRCAGIPLTVALANVQSIANWNQSNFDVLGLVFPAAVVPEDGESLTSAMRTNEAAWVKIEGDSSYLPTPEQTLYSTPTPQALVWDIAARVVPHYKPLLLRQIGKADWNEDPSMYVKIMKGESTSTECKDHMFEKLRNALTGNGEAITAVELECDHIRMICIPDRQMEEIMGFVDALGLS